MLFLGQRGLASLRGAFSCCVRSFFGLTNRAICGWQDTTRQFRDHAHPNGPLGRGNKKNRNWEKDTTRKQMDSGINRLCAPPRRRKERRRQAQKAARVKERPARCQTLHAQERRGDPFFVITFYFVSLGFPHLLHLVGLDRHYTALFILLFLFAFLHAHAPCQHAPSGGSARGRRTCCSTTTKTGTTKRTKKKKTRRRRDCPCGT